MVKLTAPMLSLAASGTIADAITFASWKGRPYARERVIPANPRSGAQVGRRAMFTMLTQAWNGDYMNDTRRATWQDLADQLVASPFNGFMSHNMALWHNFLSPTLSTPPEGAEAGSALVMTAAAWEENRIKLTFDAVPIAFDIGVGIFAKLAGAVTPAVGNCIMVTLHDSADIFSRFWTPPEVGTWHFDSRVMSRDGIMEAAGGAQQAAP